MKPKKLRKKLGSYLKKLRLGQKMPLDVVVEELRDLKISCSKPNLSKLERDIISCRTEVFAGLMIIYESSAEEALFY